MQLHDLAHRLPDEIWGKFAPHLPKRVYADAGRPRRVVLPIPRDGSAASRGVAPRRRLPGRVATACRAVRAVARDQLESDSAGRPKKPSKRGPAVGVESGRSPQVYERSAVSE